MAPMSCKQEKAQWISWEKMDPTLLEHLGSLGRAREQASLPPAHYPSFFFSVTFLGKSNKST